MNLSSTQHLELIEKAMSIVGPEGSYGMDKDLQLKIYLEILWDCLDENRFGKFKRNVSQEAMFIFMIRALAKVNKSKNQQKKTAFNQALLSELEQNKIHDLKFIFLVNIELPIGQPPTNMRFDGVKVEWLTGSQFYKSKYYFPDYPVKFKESVDNIYRKDVFQSHFSLLVMKISGINNDQMIQNAIKAYDQFLGLVNLSKSIGSISYSFGIYQNCSYSKLTGMNTIFILDDNNKLDTVTILQYSICDEISFDKKNISDLNKWYNLYNKIDNNYDIYDELQLFLILYQHAMKSPELDVRFLQFWQIIELFLKKDNSDTNDIVINRAKCIFNKSWMAKECLEVFRKKRNLMVHKGSADLTQDDIMIIKYISEEIFKYFIFQNKRYDKKRFIFEMLELMEFDKKALLEKRKVINSILNKMDE